MIDSKVKYLAVLFLNATDIQANSQNISKLMTEFADKELIPNTYQEFPNLIQIPLIIPQVLAQSRFQLSSANKEWVIKFGSMRIDFEKNLIDLKGSNLGDLKEFCNEANKTFLRILKLYPRKANRVAVVSRFFLKESTEEQLQTLYSKLFNAPKIYKDHKPFEWNWRSASRIQHKINELNEEFNYITQIIRTFGEVRVDKEVNPINRIDLSIDINSSPSNTDNRFGEIEINNFFDNVHLWHDDLILEFTDFLK